VEAPRVPKVEISHELSVFGTNTTESTMTRRSANWNEGLARDLRKRDFAQAFIQGCLDEGLSVQDSLAKVIRAYGIKEFSVKAGLPSSNVLRAISPGYNPTVDTLNTLLKPFALSLSVVPRRKVSSRD
jgi:DNA-binding phage protein